MSSAATKKMIKVRSAELGISLAVLARELGVSRQFVYQVCTGRRTTARVRHYLCRRLNLHPAQLGWSHDNTFDRQPAQYPQHGLTVERAPDVSPIGRP
jgi:transcriptional regulator with XRE-family HTH domain